MRRFRTSAVLLLLLPAVLHAQEEDRAAHDLPPAKGYRMATGDSWIFVPGRGDTSRYRETHILDGEGRPREIIREVGTPTVSRTVYIRRPDGRLAEERSYGASVHLISPDVDSAYYDTAAVASRVVYSYPNAQLSQTDFYDWSLDALEHRRYALTTYDARGRPLEALHIYVPDSSVTYSHLDERGNVTGHSHTDTTRTVCAYTDSTVEMRHYQGQYFLGTKTILRTPAGAPLRTTSRDRRRAVTREETYRCDSAGRLLEHRIVSGYREPAGAIFFDRTVHSYDAEGKRTGSRFYRRGRLCSEQRWTYAR